MARELQRASSAAPLWIAAVSIVITVLVWSVAANSITDRDQARFDNAVRHVRSRIEDRMARHVNLVRSTQAMVIVAKGLDRDRFKRYVDSLRIDENYAGMLALGISMKIPPAEKDRILGELRKQGWKNFSYHPPYRETHAIIFIEPENPSNNVAIGFNMMSEPVRREAMMRATALGAAALSGQVQLVQDVGTNRRHGFLLYYPIYETLSVPKESDRDRALVGFAYSAFRGDDLFTNLYATDVDPHVYVSVYDGTQLDEAKLLYRSKEIVPGRRPQMTTVMQSVIAGRSWTIEYQSSPGFEHASDLALLYWIPPLGLVVTLLLTMLSWRQARDAGALALQTAQLQRREFQQRLLAEAGALLNRSLDFETTLASVADLAVPGFADWAAVDIADENGKVRRLAITHVKPEKVEWARQLQEKYPPDPNAPTGVPHVIRTGESELYENLTPEMLRPMARDEEMWRIIEEVGFSSAMVVPITARGKVLGALSFVWAESGRHYDKEDLELAKELGFRAGVAVDNAKLYQDAELERIEVSRLNTNLERLVSERTSDLETAVSELEAFSYSVSHDLRAPLRAVDGFSRSLLDDYGDLLDDTAKGYIDRIRSAARRMDELISALLGLSRITRAEMDRREVDFSELAREAGNDARAAFGNQVEVSVQEGLKAQADDRMLHIVLDNLIGNAVKFSARSENPKVEVGSLNGAFFVRDNGIGFNPDYSAKLFAPFERLHSIRDYPGSGIGLATVSRIIARHGGKIWAESKEGEGATFFFTLS